MPIRHIVLVKFHPGLSSDGAQAWYQIAISTLHKIDVVKNIEVSTDKVHSDRDEGFDRCIIVDFDNAEDLHNVYAPHAIHDEYKNKVKPYVEKVQIFDMVL